MKRFASYLYEPIIAVPASIALAGSSAALRIDRKAETRQ